MQTCTTTDSDTATARPGGAEEVTRLGTNLTAAPSASSPASSLPLHGPTECSSGRLLHIALVGSFTGVAASNSAVDLSGRPEGDAAFHAVLVTADPPRGTYAKKVARPEPSCLARGERRSTCSSTGRGQRREVRAWGGELGAELSVRDTKAFRADQHLMRAARTWSARPSVSDRAYSSREAHATVSGCACVADGRPPVEFPVSTRANVKRLVEK